MPQEPPVWEEIKEFSTLIHKLIEKFPERFSHIEQESIVAYKCVNKTKPEKKNKYYDMSSQSEPESFTNSKKYFIKIFHDVWDMLPDNNRACLVFSALCRIPADDPTSGKLLGYDFQDQSIMARTFGLDWILKSDLPNLLRDNIEFKDEPN